MALLLTAAAPVVTDPSVRPAGSGLTASDMFRLRTVGAVAISPDGTLAAYVVRDPDLMTDGFRTSIHVIDVSSGTERRVLPGADQPA